MNNLPFKVMSGGHVFAATRAAPKELQTAERIVCRPLTWKIPANVQLENLDTLMTNEHGRCASCKRAIWYRPGLPPSAKKICVVCYLREPPAKLRRTAIYRMFLKQAKLHGETP